MLYQTTSVMNTNFVVGMVVVLRTSDAVIRLLTVNMEMMKLTAVCIFQSYSRHMLGS